MAKGTASVIVELIFKLEEEVPLDVIDETTLFGLAGELNPVTTDTASANCTIESFILLYYNVYGMRTAQQEGSSDNKGGIVSQFFLFLPFE